MTYLSILEAPGTSRENGPGLSELLLIELFDLETRGLELAELGEDLVDWLLIDEFRFTEVVVVPANLLPVKLEVKTSS